MLDADLLVIESLEPVELVIHDINWLTEIWIWIVNSFTLAPEGEGMQVY